MSNVLVVIPVLKETAAMAERMLDLIYWQHKSDVRMGECLLCFAPDVHLELQKKVLLAAELSFTVETAPGITTLRSAAEHVAKAYKSPWLYLEPDCVPLRKGWLSILSDAYEKQPKRYFGPFLKRVEKETFLSRIAIYPPDAANDPQPAISMARQTKLIQELRFDGDESKIRSDAVLLHGDRTGMLVEKMIAEYSRPPETNGNQFEKEDLQPEPSPKRRPGRPRKNPLPA